MKITPAMRKRCKELARGEHDGYRMTYVMAGNMRKAGLVTIELRREPKSLFGAWPYGNWKTVLTEEGKKVAAGS